MKKYKSKIKLLFSLSMVFIFSIIMVLGLTVGRTTLGQSTNNGTYNTVTGQIPPPPGSTPATPNGTYNTVTGQIPPPPNSTSPSSPSTTATTSPGSNVVDLGTIGPSGTYPTTTPSATTSAGLVPCGTATSPCTLCYLITGVYNLVKFGLSILVAAALAAIAFAGVMYAVSSGSEKLMSAAKSFLTSALAGFAIVLAAWLIVSVTMALISAKSDLGIGKTGANFAGASYQYTCTGGGSTTPSTSPSTAPSTAPSTSPSTTPSTSPSASPSTTPSTPPSATP